MAENSISNTHRDMASMAHEGQSDVRIAEHVKMSAGQLGEEWDALQDQMRAVTREEAIELIVAQMILEAREALGAAQEKLALVIASREGKAVLTFNNSGVITGLSPYAERMLGLPKERILGHPIDSLLDTRSTGVEQSSEEMQRAETGAHVESVRIHRRGDGSTFKAEHCVIAIIGRSGHVSGFIRDIEDVTQRRMHEVKIAELNASIALLVHK